MSVSINRFLLAVMLVCVSMSARGFDHSHQAWTVLLQRHVEWLPGGHASVVDYAGIQSDQDSLDAYLATLSAVSQDAYEGWSEEQRLAFLINAYNAYTVSLILTRYPKLVSIKDLGSLFRSPWKMRFFTLLGEERHLDEVEHEMIREPGQFDEPRIHFAVNCASIGCPALRHEAYRADGLSDQLDDQAVRFITDQDRNHAEPERGMLHLSPIFDWYEDDFELGEMGGVADFLGHYREHLEPAMREVLQSPRPRIRYTDYDWSLNDVP